MENWTTSLDYGRFHKAFDSDPHHRLLNIAQTLCLWDSRWFIAMVIGFFLLVDSKGL